MKTLYKVLTAVAKIVLTLFLITITLITITGKLFIFFIIGLGELAGIVSKAFNTGYKSK